MHEEHGGDLVGRRSIHVIDDSLAGEVVDSPSAMKPLVKSDSASPVFPA